MLAEQTGPQERVQCHVQRAGVGHGVGEQPVVAPSFTLVQRGVFSTYASNVSLPSRPPGKRHKIFRFRRPRLDREDPIEAIPDVVGASRVPTPLRDVAQLRVNRS